MNRFEQDAHRHGTMKRRFRNHSKTPCLLARRTKEDPHWGHTKTGFTTAPFFLFAPNIRNFNVEIIKTGLL
jgi:hypothetical protein